MKIVLAALNAKYVHSNLAVYDLQAYAKKQWQDIRNAQCTQLSQNNREMDNEKCDDAFGREVPEILIREYTINHNLDMILQSLYQEKAAVVAFSCYIWNIKEVLTIARELKKVAPKLEIWLGGPEVSFDSDALLEEHPYVNGIMVGEGEATFFDLTVQWFNELDGYKNVIKTTCKNEENESKRAKKCDYYQNVQGIVYRDQEGIICTNGRRPLIRLDEVPFIYQDMSLFQNKIVYYETSRGCPFSCSYCLSSIDKTVRFRSMKLVEKELQFFLDQKVPQVKFIDRTFNCKREHAQAIWRYLLEHDNGVTNFHFEIAADLLDETDLDILKRMRPGCVQLEIGLQSTNYETIREIRRVMDVTKLKDKMLKIRSYRNIHQHLDLIAGLPFEDFETFKKSFEDAFAMKPDQLQLGFLKVLKGSYMGEQVAAYELQYQDTQPYEVLSTKWITYDEILKLKQVEEMVEVYYNSAQFEHVLSYILSFYSSSYAFFAELGEFYEKHDLYGIGYKRERRYEVLRQFCMERFEKCDEFSDDILDDLLTYDYYLRENAKARPSWSPQEPVEKELYQTFFKNGGTEEICLQAPEYDSKVAARIMHIEPVDFQTVFWLEEHVGDLTNERKEWKEQNKNKQHTGNDQVYCLFDYQQRSPLSKDAKVTRLSHL